MTARAMADGHIAAVKALGTLDHYLDNATLTDAERLAGCREVRVALAEALGLPVDPTPPVDPADRMRPLPVPGLPISGQCEGRMGNTHTDCPGTGRTTVDGIPLPDCGCPCHGDLGHGAL